MNTLQATVLKSLLTRSNWDALKDVVDEEVFTETNARRLYNMIRSLHQDTSKDITIEMLSIHLETVMVSNGTTRVTLQDSISLMLDSPDIPSDQLDGLIKRFLVRSGALKELTYLAAHIEDEDLDIARSAKVFVDLAQISVGIDTTLVEIGSAPPPSANDRIGVVPFGFNVAMDKALCGGRGNGELVIILGPPKTGKTSHLISAATTSAQLGENVLHISLEINGTKCCRAVDRKLTGMTKDELITNPIAAMKARKLLPGKLWIKDWSHARVSVADIRALVLSMSTSETPVTDLVVDYMELLHPDNKGNAKWGHYKQVTQDLRALGAEFGIKVLTAWQTNKAGAEKHVLSKVDVGEDWNVVKIADIIIGLNQNPKELENKIMRHNIIEQRESTTRGIFYADCDLDRMQIKQRTKVDSEIEPVVVEYGKEC